MIKRFIASHQFFLETSPGYVGESGWKYWRHFPAAYCKFMWLMMSQPPMFDPLDESTDHDGRADTRGQSDEKQNL